MNLWNKITLGTKFLFGGWEAALDYLLNFLNEFLARPNVADKAAKLRSTCEYALNFMLRLKEYVPEKWQNEYNAIIDVVADIIAVTRDNRITAEEVKTLAASFAEAKKLWEED